MTKTHLIFKSLENLIGHAIRKKERKKERRKKKEKKKERKKNKYNSNLTVYNYSNQIVSVKAGGLYSLIVLFTICLCLGLCKKWRQGNYWLILNKGYLWPLI